MFKETGKREARVGTIEAHAYLTPGKEGSLSLKTLSKILRHCPQSSFVGHSTSLHDDCWHLYQLLGTLSIL